MPKIKTPERVTVEDLLLSATGYKVGDMLYYKHVTPFLGYVVLNDRSDFTNSHPLSNGAQVVAPESDNAAHVSVFRRGVASIYRVDGLQTTNPNVKRIDKISYSPRETMGVRASSPDSLVYVIPSSQWQTLNLTVPTIDPHRHNIGTIVQSMDTQQLNEFKKIAAALIYVEYAGNNSSAAA